MQLRITALAEAARLIVKHTKHSEQCADKKSYCGFGTSTRTSDRLPRHSVCGTVPDSAITYAAAASRFCSEFPGTDESRGTTVITHYDVHT